jgi:hypothetical protein
MDDEKEEGILLVAELIKAVHNVNDALAGVTDAIEALKASIVRILKN